MRAGPLPKLAALVGVGHGRLNAEAAGEADERQNWRPTPISLPSHNLQCGAASHHLIISPPPCDN